MRMKAVTFVIDRAAWSNLIVLSRLLLTADFETVNNQWEKKDLVLWNLEDFLGFDENLKTNLDKSSLQLIHQRLKDDCKYRKDCFKFKLRPAKESETRIFLEFFQWPAQVSERQKLFTDDQWETDIEKSRFAAPQNYHWLNGCFLVSLLQSVLFRLPTFDKIAYEFEKLHFVQNNTKWINRQDGRGLVRCKFLPIESDNEATPDQISKKRKTSKREEEKSSDTQEKNNRSATNDGTLSNTD